MHSLLAGLLHYIKIITCYILWGMMLDLQTRQNNNFIHDDALTYARTHTQTHNYTHCWVQSIFILHKYLIFLHWFDGIRNNNHLEWKGEMHFFEWLRQIFVFGINVKKNHKSQISTLMNELVSAETFDFHNDLWKSCYS